MRRRRKSNFAEIGYYAIFKFQLNERLQKCQQHVQEAKPSEKRISKSYSTHEIDLSKYEGAVALTTNKTAPNAKEFGGRIRDLRTKKGITQEQLSIMLNVSANHLAKVETGSRCCSIELLQDLSSCLNVRTEMHRITTI